jgi:hypothetical protein
MIPTTYAGQMAKLFPCRLAFASLEPLKRRWVAQFALIPLAFLEKRHPPFSAARRNPLIDHSNSTKGRAAFILPSEPGSPFLRYPPIFVIMYE